jgi:putative flippase GtrA
MPIIQKNKIRETLISAKRYFFVGATAAFFDIGLYSLGVKIFNFNWFYVSIFSFVIAVVVNYLLSVRYVFKSKVRFKAHEEIFLVFIASGIGLTLNIIILFILIEILYCEEIFSKLVATGFIFFWNYSIRNFFIFKENSNL